MSAKPTDIDSYIAAAPAHMRGALSDLRAALHANLAARGVVVDEVISYSMPGRRLPGRGPVVAGFAAWVKHCSFYPHSGSVLPAFADRIGTRGHTKSALHFTPEDPIPPDLLHDLLTARLAEAGAL